MALKLGIQTYQILTNNDRQLHFGRKHKLWWHICRWLRQAPCDLTMHACECVFAFKKLFKTDGLWPKYYISIWNHSLSLSKIGHYFCMPLYLPMSSSVAFWAQTQNLMTYLSLTEAGTMWSLPDALMVDNSFWFSSSEPRSLKQTNPSYIKKKRNRYEIRFASTN